MLTLLLSLLLTAHAPCMDFAQVRVTLPPCPATMLAMGMEALGDSGLHILMDRGETCSTWMIAHDGAMFILGAWRFGSGPYWIAGRDGKARDPEAFHACYCALEQHFPGYVLWERGSPCQKGVS